MTQSSVLSPHNSSLWLWLVLAFVIFGGIANGMIAWAATFRVAQARWTPAINRILHATLYFIPVLAVLLVVLLIGAKNYVPWIAHPDPLRGAWLNLPFMIARNLVAMGALWVLWFLLVRWSLAADAKVSRGEEITRAEHKRLNSIAVAVVMVYTVASSVVSFDFMMSLTPGWSSTMFAPYYFCTNIYVAMAVTILLCAWLRRKTGVGEHIQAQQFQDMGNLLLAFSLFNMGLFFAQYLTIWYESLPEETGFMILRYLRGPWPKLGWAAFIVGYAIPFVLLQSRTLKRTPRLVCPVAVLVVLGVSLERYVLVVPSLEPTRLLLNPWGIIGMLGFAGVFILTIGMFLRRYSPVSAADAALSELEEAE